MTQLSVFLVAAFVIFMTKNSDALDPVSCYVGVTDDGLAGSMTKQACTSDGGSSHTCGVFWEPQTTAQGKRDSGKWYHMCVTDKSTFCPDTNIYAVGTLTGLCAFQADINLRSKFPVVSVAMRCHVGADELTYNPRSYADRAACNGACKVEFKSNKKYTWSCVPADRYIADCAVTFDKVVTVDTTSYMCCKDKNCEPGNPPVATPPGAADTVSSFTCLKSSGVDAPVGTSTMYEDSQYEVCTGNDKFKCHTTYDVVTKKYSQGCAPSTCTSTMLTANALPTTGGVKKCCYGTNCNDQSIFTPLCWASGGIATPQNLKTMTAPSDGASGVCRWRKFTNSGTFSQDAFSEADFNSGTSGCSGILNEEIHTSNQVTYCCRGYGCNTVPTNRLNPTSCLSSSNSMLPTDSNVVQCGADTKSCHWEMSMATSTLGRQNQGCSSSFCGSTGVVTDTTNVKKTRCCGTNNCNKAIPITCHRKFDDTENMFYTLGASSRVLECSSPTGYCFVRHMVKSYMSLKKNVVYQGCTTDINDCDSSKNGVWQFRPWNGGNDHYYCCTGHLCNIPQRWSFLSCLSAPKSTSQPVTMPAVETCGLTDHFCSWIWSKNMYQQRCQPTCTAAEGYSGCCQHDYCNHPPVTRCFVQTSYQNTVGQTEEACSANNGAMSDVFTDADLTPKTHCMIVKKLGTTPQYVQKCIGAKFFYETCQGKQNVYVPYPKSGTATHELFCCHGNNCNSPVAAPLIPATTSAPPALAPRDTLAAVLLLAVF